MEYNKFMENSLDHELLGTLPPRFPEVNNVIQQAIQKDHDKLIRDHFPIKIWITPWALLGNRWNTSECVGARTLKRALKKIGLSDINVSWGNEEGGFRYNNKVYVISSDISMMNQYLPRRVTLRIIN